MHLESIEASDFVHLILLNSAVIFSSSGLILGPGARPEEAEKQNIGQKDADRVKGSKRILPTSLRKCRTLHSSNITEVELGRDGDRDQ